MNVSQEKIDMAFIPTPVNPKIKIKFLRNLWYKIISVSVVIVTSCNTHTL